GGGIASHQGGLNTLEDTSKRHGPGASQALAAPIVRSALTASGRPRRSARKVISNLPCCPEPTNHRVPIRLDSQRPSSRSSRPGRLPAAIDAGIPQRDPPVRPDPETDEIGRLTGCESRLG